MSDDRLRPESARNIYLVGYTDQGGRPDGAQVTVAHGHAYVSHPFSGGLTVIDVRDPSRPAPVLSHPLILMVQ